MSLLDPTTRAARTAEPTGEALIRGQEIVGARYLLGHPAEYVIVSTGTVHLRRPGDRRTICGTLINLDGPSLPTYSVRGHHTVTCVKCGVVCNRAEDAYKAAKRAK